MSTVQVSNIHFESTGNNRIQVEGSNLSIFSSGNRFITANATVSPTTPGGGGGTGGTRYIGARGEVRVWVIGPAVA